MTPTEERILALALDACYDDDAKLVLSDAIEETGWRASIRYPEPGEELYSNVGKLLALVTWWVDGDDRPLNREHCRAIAAVLLFRDWPTSWPLAKRCRVSPLQDWLSEDVTYETVNRWVEDFRRFTTAQVPTASDPSD